MTDAVLLALLIFLVAALYSTVGHAGASGYLASMALMGVAPSVMRPAALVLNLLVSTIATVRFARAGCFHWRTFAPFAAASLPFALIGGYLELPNPIYRRIVGAILIYAAIRLFAKSTTPAGQTKLPPTPVAAGIGGAIGLLSGLIGVGGGIFLSPILMLMNWADPRRTAGVSAAFILINSAAGLVGHIPKLHALPTWLPFGALAAILGGAIGSHLGARKFAGPTIRRLLAMVLVVAAVKMMLPVRKESPASQPVGRVLPSADTRTGNQTH